MKTDLLELFTKTIAAETGLQIRGQDLGNLSQKISVRMKVIKLANLEQYYQLLNSKTQEAIEEWKKLIISLTTTETYFFRDRGQINLLKNVILPELISKKRLSNNKTLRLWSAGCSTGEEPYSLAILVRELIPDWQDWNIFILGTDVNEIVLEKAKKAIYSSWSFRQVDFQVQSRYFQVMKGEWKLDDDIKNMVNLSSHNLVKDDYPENLDLIVCRNVFVYFKPDLISLVIKKFYQALILEGYLITAHAELYGQSLDAFKVKIFPESLVYQRSKDRVEPESQSWQFNQNFQEKKESKNQGLLPNKSSNMLLSYSQQKKEIIPLAYANNPKKELPVIIPKREVTKNIVSSTILAEAEILFQHKKYALAIEKAEKAIASEPKNYAAYCLIAQVYANLGEYNSAELYCKKALEVDPFSVSPYYLLVHIAEERGEREKAKSLLKRIIYMCPSSISAYVELADIYESEGEITRSKKMKNTALELLKKLPENSLVEYRGEISASDFIKYLKQLLLKN